MPILTDDNGSKFLRLEFPIYTFNIDYSHHVSNLVYIQWMEAARCTLMEAVGMPIAKVGEDGLLPVLTDTQIRYINPLYMGDVAQVDAWITELRGASAWVETHISNGEGKLCAVGRQKGLYVRADTLRPHRFSAEERALYLPFIRNSEGGGK